MKLILFCLRHLRSRHISGVLTPSHLFLKFYDPNSNASNHCGPQTPARLTRQLCRIKPCLQVNSVNCPLNASHINFALRIVINARIIKENFLKISVSFPIMTVMPDLKPWLFDFRTSLFPELSVLTTVFATDTRVRGKAIGLELLQIKF